MKSIGFKIALVISLSLHAGVVILFVWLGINSAEKAAGDVDYVVSIDIISDSRWQIAEDRLQTQESEPDSRRTTHDAQRTAHSAQRTAHDERRTAHGAHRTASLGTPGAGGGNQILAKIKAKIERAKTYPRLAQRKGIEGRPIVLFEINPDGSIKSVSISSSSGRDIIDNAAIETVKRAAPLPYFEKPIQLAIKYELR